MKALQVLCLAAAASIAVAGAASAATVSPAGVSFTASGPTNLVYAPPGITPVSLACNATFNGTTDSTGAFASVTSASFSGGPLGICATVAATNLPWKITASSTTAVVVQGVAVNTPIGNCSPTDLNASWANGPAPTGPSTMTFTNQHLNDYCTVSGRLSAPLILIP